MRFRLYKSMLQLSCAAVVVLSGSAVYSDAPATRQIPGGEKAKVTGTILSRSGDLVTVKEKKSGDLVRLNLFEDTKIERKKGKFLFVRRPRMDITAMLPGLTIEAEGIGNERGELDANKIVFSPDEFAIAIAAEQQIMANQAAAQSAQSTATQGVEAANAAQASANQAQSSAAQAQGTANRAAAGAEAAVVLGTMDAAAVELVNKRVSQLDDYKIVAEASIFFGNNQAVLDDAAKQALSDLARQATSLDGYMIEIAGYASKSGSQDLNQKLSEERAAAVADYLREYAHIPFRRILAPAGYGATRIIATEANPSEGAIDRRVDVKVLVNKGLRAAE